MPEELIPAARRVQGGLPVGIYVQGAGGSALATTLAAASAGAQLIAVRDLALALTLHRVSGEALAEALAGMGLDPGIDVATLWEASDIVDEHIGDEPVAPLAPRIAVRAAQHDVPAGLVAGVDATLRAQGAGDRLEEVLEELDLIRAEVGWPPLAAPIGQVLASQALLNVLSASRYLTIVDELRALVTGGRFGTPPGPIDPAVRRAVELPANDRVRGGRGAAALRGARAGRGHGGERGGAAPARALRRGRRAAAARHPRPHDSARRTISPASTRRARSGSASS